MRERILESPDYATFRERMAASGCTLCPLSTGRTHIVVDRGNPGARILAIGEAPGAEEDRTGRAFCGRSGRLLDELLAEIGLDSNRDLLIANVAKCRPPGNRPPTTAEAEACLPFLRRQIDLLDPETILFLGATALKRLLPHLAAHPMADLVGRPTTDPAFPGRRLLPLYHPAFLLRNPRRRPAYLAHLAALRPPAPRRS